MSDVPQQTASLAAEIDVLRMVVVELVRRLPQEDQTAIEALVQQLARTAEDLSALPAAGDAAEEVPHHQSAAVRQFLVLLQL
jgi:cell division FtsZ-interacting protein ZapD